MRLKRSIERKVREDIERHLEAVRRCLEEFSKAISAYLEGDLAGAEEASMRVHRLESEADTARRGIQRGLYLGAFPPLLREDFLKLAELVDSAANRAEEACDQLVLERPDIPQEIREEVSSIPFITIEAFEELSKAIRSLWENLDEAVERAEAVQAREHQVDQLRWKALQKVFRSNLDMARRIQLRDFIVKMSEISDRIEDASDYIAVVAVKSRV